MWRSVDLSPRTEIRPNGTSIYTRCTTSVAASHSLFSHSGALTCVCVHQQQQQTYLTIRNGRQTKQNKTQPNQLKSKSVNIRELCSWCCGLNRQKKTNISNKIEKFAIYGISSTVRSEFFCYLLFDEHFARFCLACVCWEWRENREKEKQHTK